MASALIGNREPLFQAGISTTFRYKNFKISALFDGRLGGDVANITARSLWSNGMHKALEQYRGRQVVWEGVVDNGDGTYSPNTTPIVLDYSTITNYYSAVSSNFIEDGSYISLRHLTLSYDFTSLVNKRSPITNLSVSLTGTNLFILTKYTGSNPMINASSDAGGTGSGGIDNYAVPTTRGFNFSFNIGF